MSTTEGGTPRATPEERKKPDRSPRTGSPDQVQQALDDALADSFPASDPVSIVTSQREECWDVPDQEDDSSRDAPF